MIDIKAEMDRQEVTVGEIAQILGVTRQRVHQHLKQTDIKVSTLEKYAAALGKELLWQDQNKTAR